MNRPARGDTRPCMRAGCSGQMQYGREPIRIGGTVSTDMHGWACAADATHFMTAAAGDAGLRSNHSRWDDDGGGTR